MSGASGGGKVDPTAMIHSHALVDAGASIGPETRVWAFAHVLSGARWAQVATFATAYSSKTKWSLAIRSPSKMGSHSTMA